MVTKDVKSYLENRFADYYEMISDLSKSDEENVLVGDGRRLYNFDKITEKIYPKKRQILWMQYLQQVKRCF